MKKIFLLLFCLFSSVCFSQDLIAPSVSKAIYLDGDKNLVWNKWDTSNFIVLSIDKSQGLKLKDNIEYQFSSILRRWNLQAKLPIPCKIMNVPDKKTLSRLFNIEKPHAEVRYDSDGNVNVCAIWIDFESREQLPSLITSVCLSDKVCNTENLWFIQRGISCLEKPINDVKKHVSSNSLIDAKSLLSTSRENWTSMTQQEKESFDCGSSLVCLLLRKEFGDVLFSKFMENQTSDSVLSVFKFKDQNQLNSIIKRYSENLSEDINKDRTPESYLIIE